MADSRTAVELINSDYLFIPAGYTPLVQLLDVTINRPFKDKMEDLWVLWHRQHRQTTKMGNPKQPTRQNVINWVSTAWEGTREDVIRDAFVKCGLTANPDGSNTEKVYFHIPGVLANLKADYDVESDEEDAMILWMILIHLRTDQSVLLCNNNKHICNSSHCSSRSR